MFENYTGETNRTIFFARFAASQYGGRSIEMPHLLLGLVRESKSIFEKAPGLDSATLQTTVEALCPKLPERVATSVDMQLSESCRRVLTYAEEEAEALGYRCVGTQHVLLGILRENGPEAQALARLGFRLDALRKDMAAERHPGL